MLLCYAQTNTASELLTKKTVDGICYNIWTGSTDDYAYVTSPESGRYTGEITIPSYISYEGKKYSVREIGYLAFYMATVTKITLPNSIKEIDTNAFLGCGALSELTIPFSVEKIGKRILGGCLLNLNIKTDKITNWTEPLEDLNTSSNIYTYQSQISAVSRAFKGNVINVADPYWVDFWKIYLKGVRFKINENPYYTGGHTIKSITVDKKQIELRDDNTYFVKGLPLSCYFPRKIPVTLSYTNENSEEIEQTSYFEQPAPTMSYTIRETYCSLIANVETSSDETATPESAEFQISDKERPASYKANETIINGKAKVTIDKLIPRSIYTNATIIISYKEDDGIIKQSEGYRKNYFTQTYPCCKLKPSTKPNSISVSAYYLTLSKDINITKAIIYIKEGEEQELTANAKTFVFKGLIPKGKYNIKQAIYSGNKLIGEDVTTCNTDNLELITEVPHNVTSTSALVAAKTNIGEEDDENVGFEWRKTDAPDVVASKFGKGVIYDGVLEGRINNLNSSSYYKVRPFYKASNGTTYYGEWIGFDPSDFSYFEPTVHTYTRASVEGTSARVRGVALQGTDDLLEQGFEYWADNTASSRAAAVKQTIQATGQSMEAEITDLTPGYTYSYRAYAKTSKGTTYGETQQFTIPVPTAINGVADMTSSKLQFSVKSSSGVQMTVNGTSKEECTYRISDITGNCMAFGKIAADGAWHSITATKPSPGIYIITVSDGNNIKSVKIVIK